MSLDLNVVRQQTITIAREAGAILLDYFHKPVEVMFKGTFDVVTEADKNAEKHIVNALQAAYPDHHIVGEEGGNQGAAGSDADYHWYIDPLDGTTNFANKIPFFCVSIALADKNNTPLVGVIYAPVSDELYVAAQGMGATLNDKPLRVSGTTELANAVIVTNLPFTDNLAQYDKLFQANYFAPRVRGVRRFGSAALEMCWVARGIADAYWEYPINRWDFMAGILIVREAGGTVTDYYGEPGTRLIDEGQVFVSNTHLHPEILKGMAVIRENAR